MYLTWDSRTTTNFSDSNINSLYNEGYLFGRTGKGDMYQTRSLRIDLSKFELSSENRRVLKKTEELQMEKFPLPYAAYDWTIGKMGKDFYETKFGKGTFSANKIKELMTDKEKSNFNVVLTYTLADAVGAQYFVPSPTVGSPSDMPANARVQNIEPLRQTIGYCISLETHEIFHYCYPFYQLNDQGVYQYAPTANPQSPPNIGLGMMLRAILHAKDTNKKYIYLGSFSRPSDTYKLQFAGLEWWDGEGWKMDLEELKNILKNSNE